MLIRILKRIWKWILGIVLLVAFVNGGIALYKYLHDVYIPKRKLDKAVSDIVKKFHEEQTRTEYAMYILEYHHDWGLDILNNNIQINNEEEFRKEKMDRSLKNDYISHYELYRYRKEAFDWIESRAFQGDAECQYQLAKIYYWGNKKYYIIGEPNKEKSAYWSLKSAQNGFVKAYNNIGLDYLNGSGVRKNIENALYWFKKGAEANEPWAQLNYGDLFLKGVPVGDNVFIHDVEQAKYWWEKSAAQGNEVAKERLQKIYEIPY